MKAFSPAIAVILSGHGRGTNMIALADACESGEIAGHVTVVIGTQQESPAMARAVERGIPARIVSPGRYVGDDNAYGAALMQVLSEEDIGLICLAGYMRRIPDAVTEAYAGRIMNVHPALLPLFGGKGMYGRHVHQAVLESGMKVTGCTVHFVDEQYDTGPIIVQKAIAIGEHDTPETLAERVLPLEHAAYVEAVQLFALGRLRIYGRRVAVEEDI